MVIAVVVLIANVIIMNGNGDDNEYNFQNFGDNYKPVVSSHLLGIEIFP